MIPQKSDPRVPHTSLSDAQPSREGRGNARQKSLDAVITLVCVVCGRHVALRLDADDLERHRAGVLVQDAFADENGVPYLSAAERELFITATCGDCYALLCADPITHPEAYN